MKDSVTKRPGSIIELEVTLTADEFKVYFLEARSEAIAHVEVKGFRKGAAPAEIAERAIDPNVVFDHAVEEAVRVSLKEIGEKYDWIIVDQPKVEVVEASPKAGEAGLRYKATFPVFPEVKLGNYVKIAKRIVSERKPTEVADSEIDETIDWVRKSRATTVLVTRPAERGDLIEADIESMLGGAPIPGGALTKDRFVIGESRFVPGFDEKLVGHSASETVEFSLKAPDDYWNVELRGKEITFKVKISGVFSRTLPPLDDAFAKSLGPRFETIGALKESVKSGILFEKTEKELDHSRAKILEEISKETTVDIPEVMVRKTLEGMVEEMKSLSGGKSGISDEALRLELETRARERVKANLVVHAIVEKEHIEPSKEEVEAEAKARNLDPDKEYDYAYGIVRHRKLFEFLEK